MLQDEGDGILLPPKSKLTFSVETSFEQMLVNENIISEHWATLRELNLEAAIFS